MIELLQQYDRKWVLPYITVMYSTGPLFLSVIWKEYMQDKPSESGRVRILMQDEYNKFSWSFFTHHTGNSWHGKDAHFIFWVRQSPVRCLSHSLTLLLDGPTLGVPDFLRLHPRRYCRHMPVVDIRPNHASRREVPLPIHQGALHHQPATVVLSHASCSPYDAHTAPPCELQGGRRDRRGHRDLI